MNTAMTTAERFILAAWAYFWIHGIVWACRGLEVVGL